MQKMFRRALVATLLALAVPASVFAATANLTLKDNSGNALTDLTGITVTVMDSVGGIVTTATPTQATVTISNLLINEPYSVVVKKTTPTPVDQNGTPAVSISQRKGFSFIADDEVISKDLYIIDAAATNVMLKVTNIPETFTGVKLHLSHIDTPRQKAEFPELVFTMTPVLNGTIREASITLPTFVSGKFNWAVGNQDDSTIFTGSTVKTIRTNSTPSFNISSTQTPVANLHFFIKNPDRTDTTFGGETLAVEIKNEAGATVYTNTAAGSGSEVIWTTPNLQQGKYTMTATMTQGNLARTSTRTFSVYSSAKDVNVAFTRFADVTLDFLIRDSRSNAPITAGEIQVKDSTNTTVLETIPITGATISKALKYGYSYNFAISAPGYAPRTSIIYPRVNQVKEITLQKL